MNVPEIGWEKWRYLRKTTCLPHGVWAEGISLSFFVIQEKKEILLFWLHFTHVSRHMLKIAREKNKQARQSCQAKRSQEIYKKDQMLQELFAPCNIHYQPGVCTFARGVARLPIKVVPQMIGGRSPPPFPSPPFLAFACAAIRWCFSAIFRYMRWLRKFPFLETLDYVPQMSVK